MSLLAATPTQASVADQQKKPPIALTVQKLGYERWGRPEGMYVPGAGCSRFRDGQPTNKLNVSVNVRNDSQKPLENWYLRIFKSGGGEAFVCYYVYGDGFPKLKPGESANVTFAAFMEPSEYATEMVVVDEKAGKSDTLAFTGGISNPKAVKKGTPLATPAKPTSKAKTPVYPIELKLQKSGYERWGRPAGMDNPDAGCGPFNNGRPVNKFNVSVTVKNTSTQPMLRWYLKVPKSGGGEAFVCYYVYGNGLPSLQPGESAEVTFAAFLELNERALSAVVIDDDLGKSNELKFP